MLLNETEAQWVTERPTGCAVDVLVCGSGYSGIKSSGALCIIVPKNSSGSHYEACMTGHPVRPQHVTHSSVKVWNGYGWTSLHPSVQLSLWEQPS